MDKVVGFLLKLALFDGFTAEELKSVLQKNKAHIADYEKNCMIYLQEEECKEVSMILKGTVVVQRLNEEGNTMIIRAFQKGELLGSNLIFSTHPQYPMTVVSKTDVKLLKISKQCILEMCQYSPAFLQCFLKELSDRTLILTEKINTVAMKNIRECILSYLLAQMDEQKSSTIELPFSKKEWSEHLGVQRPSLFRVLKMMEEEGVLTTKGRKITVINGE